MAIFFFPFPQGCEKKAHPARIGVVVHFSSTCVVGTRLFFKRGLRGNGVEEQLHAARGLSVFHAFSERVFSRVVQP